MNSRSNLITIIQPRSIDRLNINLVNSDAWNSLKMISTDDIKQANSKVFLSRKYEPNLEDKLEAKRCRKHYQARIVEEQANQDLVCFIFLIVSHTILLFKVALEQRNIIYTYT